TLGALTLTRAATRTYTEADLEWAQDFSHRIGLAIENARLYAEARDLFEQAISANFVSTPERIVACNQAFAELLGFESPAEAIKARPESVYAREGDRQIFLDAIRAQRRVVGYALEFRRRDGRIVPVTENAVGVFDERGTLVRIRGFISDRSAQKDLEAQLRQSQRLEAIGQLAGGIAHDFNNLLTIIIACADLLAADRKEPMAANDPLAELTSAARRAAALTQQLLAFSRRQVLQPQVLDLNAALRAVHSMLRRLVNDNIVVMLDFDPRLPRVRVDPGQLDQVVVNLVVNAAD